MSSRRKRKKKNLELAEYARFQKQAEQLLNDRGCCHIYEDEDGNTIIALNEPNNK